MLSEQAHVNAKHWFATFAEFANTADNAWIKCHATADQRTGVGLLDHAGAINAHDLRQGMGYAGTAVAHIKVDAVHRRGLHADENFTRASAWRRSLAHSDDFISTMANKKGCLHHPCPKFSYDHRFGHRQVSVSSPRH
jgi:hypothetical protein